MSAHSLLDPDTVTIKFSVCRTAGVTKPTIGIFVPVLRARKVRLRPVGPEDWTNCLGASGRRERLINISCNYKGMLSDMTYLTPGKWLDRLHSRNQI